MARRQLPAAIAPPKGLTGIVEGYHYEPGSVLDVSQFPDGMVLLNVYDVSDSDLFTRINKVTTANNNILFGGVFHAGVEVYVKEWCYGVTDYGRSGVAAVNPRTHPQHTYKCTVPLGTTTLTAPEVEVLLQRLAQEWPGHEYDLIHHNCINFCNGLLRELIPGGRVPGWVDRVARTAGWIDTTAKKVKEDTHNTAELVRTFSADLEQKARSMSASEALDIAQKKSEKLAEKASELTATWGSNLQEWGKSAQRGLEEQAQDLPPEIGEKAKLVRRKTQELGDDLGEKAAALTASLWSWGQGMKTKSFSEVAEEASSNLQASVSQVTSFVENGSDSTPAAPRANIPMKGLLDEDDDLLLCGDRLASQESGNMGLIRAAEDKSCRRGLLEEDDDDEGIDLIGLSAAIQAPSSSTPSTSSAPTAFSAAAAAPAAEPRAPDIWDLLPPESETQTHVVYGTTAARDDSGYWDASAPPVAQAPKAPAAKVPGASANDPLDGYDLLS